jgi:hypothetical protein
MACLQEGLQSYLHQMVSLNQEQFNQEKYHLSSHKWTHNCHNGIANLNSQSGTVENRKCAHKFPEKELLTDRITRLNIPQNLRPDENYTPYQVITTTVNPSTCSAEG